MNSIDSTPGISAANDRYEKAFYYSRTPALAIDATGTVTDLNAACRQLFGTDIAGCVDQHHRHMAASLSPEMDGAILPPNGIAMTFLAEPRSSAKGSAEIVLETANLQVAGTRWIYQSMRFGRLLLQVTELPRVDTESGNCTGSFVSFEPVEGDVEIVRESISDRLRHEIMWEVYAASYDAVLPELPFYQEVVERHFRAMEPAQIDSILDVGAGTGITPLRWLDIGKSVTAVDPNRAMLRRLRRKLQGRRNLRLTIIEDTAERLPHLKNASFDGVSVLLAFFDMGDPMAAFREAERLLKPGGTMIVTEPRTCFDVESLMAAAEQALARSGALDHLHADWTRINAVAPLVSETITKTQTGDATDYESGGWSAERVLDLMREDGYLQTTFLESHQGNCATITGMKPSAPVGS